MDNSYDRYKINAMIIDALHERNKILCETSSRLDAEYVKMQQAWKYMCQLIVVIHDNPGLLDEWRYFLSVAGIKEPDWKDEYVVDRLSFD